MHFFKVTLAFALLGVAISAPADFYGQDQQQKGMPYDFDWAVRDEYSNNDFGQREQSDGNVVQGEYYVLLPDGRRQIVKYTADHHSGFVADVQYEGEARYDSPQSSQQGGYSGGQGGNQGGYRAGQASNQGGYRGQSSNQGYGR